MNLYHLIWLGVALLWAIIYGVATSKWKLVNVCIVAGFVDAVAIAYRFLGGM